jgi:hypothetical protein
MFSQDRCVENLAKISVRLEQPRSLRVNLPACGAHAPQVTRTVRQSTKQTIQEEEDC